MNVRVSVILIVVQEPTDIYKEEPLKMDNAEALRIASEAAAAAAHATEALKPVYTPAVQVSTTTAAAEVKPTPQADNTSKPSTTTPKDKPLILYAYADAESGSSRINLEFFIAHALHDAADFVFILNGETDAAKLIPTKSNIQVVQRKNDCYDLGAYAEILTKNDTYKSYKRFIFLNASIRGPFVPYWSDACWSDMYLNKVTEEVKVRSLL